MKLQALPGTINSKGAASQRQHLSCFVLDDRVAIDAGSLAFSCNEIQRKQIRDVVLTHAHLDHIAGLPLFIDDHFASLEEPVSVFALEEVIDILERNIFNWSVYPNFAELRNDNGIVLEYCPFEACATFRVKHFDFKAFPVNHKVPGVGFIVSDESSVIAISGDTASTDEFWLGVNKEEKLDALLIECAFPDDLESLAEASHHLTPKLLKTELDKFHKQGAPIFVTNLKPMYRERIIIELIDLKIENLQVLEIGKVYEF